MKTKEILTITLTNRVLSIIEKVIRLNSTVKGIENITQNSSTIFTPNHFTRCETFIVPYLLNQIPEIKFCRSLAFSSLFTSYLGKYLTNLQSISTSASNRDETIIESLANGNSNWVIYPEGMMVKDRQRQAIHNFIETKLSIKTGTAVIALKAEKMRLDSTNHQTNSILVTPITINYTPIHPEKSNKILKIVQKFAKKLPSRLEEELTVEGSLLLNSHITLEIHKPIKINEYFQKKLTILSTLNIEDPSIEDIISRYRIPISAQIAEEIYKNTHITYEHIVCGLLNEHKKINRNLLPFLIICTVHNLKKYSNIQRYENGIQDSTILKNITNIEKINHFLTLLQEQGTIEIEENIIKTTEKFHNYNEFDYVRIENISKVFINELYFFKNIKEIVQKIPTENTIEIVRQCFSYIDEIYKKIHKLTESQHSIEQKYGTARFIQKKSNIATLFIHGYKSSPFETFEIAQKISKLEISCYCHRMTGHGTSPFDMAHTKHTDWEESCEIAYKILSIHYKKIHICGFSTGGLIGLKIASKYKISSLTVINPALKLQDIRFQFVKFAHLWSEISSIIKKTTKPYITDTPVYPKTNYSINHFSCMNELSLLMNEVEKTLTEIKCNALVIYSQNDPVVAPKSSKIIYQEISSKIKFIEEIPSNEHIIIRGKFANSVSSIIKRFLM